MLGLSTSFLTMFVYFQKKISMSRQQNIIPIPKCFNVSLHILFDFINSITIFMYKIVTYLVALTFFGNTNRFLPSTSHSPLLCDYQIILHVFIIYLVLVMHIITCTLINPQSIIHFNNLLLIGKPFKIAWSLIMFPSLSCHNWESQPLLGAIPPPLRWNVFLP